MKTKLFTLLLAVAASVGTMFAWDYERVQIGDLYYNLDATNQTAEVTYKSYTNYNYNEGWGITTANIPASVTYNEITYSVTSIGNYAFLGCTGLTSVTIPNSVTSIGWMAFYDCSGLTSVTIPNSVTSIGNYAFWGCSGLTGEIVIPNSVTSIEYAAFSGCTGLTSIEIPNSVTSIGDFAFSGCTGLTSVTIGNSVTSIGDFAFQNCSNWTSVTIPGSVTSIGNGAFQNCTGLISSNVAPDNSNYCSVDGVLFNKDKTTLIQYPGAKQGAYTIPNSVASIGNYAFYGCTGLASIEIPNSVASIGNYAFRGCTGLTSIEIPNSVASIGNYAFYGCSGLTSVTIPNSVTSIGGSAFKNCTGLTSVTIGNSVTSIGQEAFCDCSGLTSVTIGNSVTSIGQEAFRGCTGLTSIEIPNSVTSIGNFAFSGCTGLTSVTIGNSVTSIESYAFYECIGLTSITCEVATPPTLGSYVFSYVDTSIPLYVPAGSVEAYQTADQWKDFTNVISLNDGDVEESNIRYIDPSYNELGSETVSLHLPDVPEIEGFIFLKWQVVAGDLEEGIIIQAVYQADESTSASSVYTNPANPAQKLIRNGNVYILSNEKTYSITGAEVK